jgi:HlyD family secretion protein
LVKATVGDIRKELSLSGTVSLKESINVSPGVGGKVAAVNVSIGDTVKSGQELLLLDISDLDNQIADAQLSLESAQLRLQQLQEPLSSLDQESLQMALDRAQADLDSAKTNQTRVTETCSMSESMAQDAVITAQSSLEDAQANLEMVQKVTAQSLASAKSDVERAQLDLDNATSDSAKKSAELSRDQARSKLETQKLSNEQQLTSAGNQVENAQSSIEKAKQSLRQQQLSNQSSLENAKSQIESAQYALRTAQIQSDQKTQTVAATDLRLQQISVEQTQSKLEQLQKQMASAVVVAPSAGTVSAMNAQVGDTVGANAIVVTLANTQALQIEASIPEVNLSQVTPGMTAKVTSDSITGKSITATLAVVNPIPTENQGVVSYTARFTLDSKATQQLKPGMSVDLSLVVAESTNAVLVPRSALQSIGSRYMVLVWDGKVFTPKPVELGVLNDSMAEIKSGVKENDQIGLTLDTTASSSNTGLPGMGGIGDMIEMPGDRGGPQVFTRP